MTLPELAQSHLKRPIAIRFSALKVARGIVLMARDAPVEPAENVSPGTAFLKFGHPRFIVVVLDIKRDRGRKVSSNR
jgi:hypothetical protein